MEQSSLADWLSESLDQFEEGLPLRHHRVLPWIFVVPADASFRDVVEAAITKGLKLVLGETALLVSPEVLQRDFKRRVGFGQAIVFIGSLDRSLLGDLTEGEIGYRFGIPAVWVLEIDNSEEKKRMLWNFIKELRVYATQP